MRRAWAVLLRDPAKGEEHVDVTAWQMRVLAASLAIAASTVASAEQVGITANSSKIGTFGALTGPATPTASCR
jgi:hypothetical protein